MESEKRYYNAFLEARADTTAGNRTITGHAAVFNQLSEDLGGFREQISTGAFSNALQEGQDVVANVNHEDDSLLGRTRSGTLKLKEDSTGLLSDIAVPNTTLGNDMLELVGRGDIDKMSFRFRVRPGGELWDFSGDIPIRTILDVDLYDVSLVTFPAYAGTDCSLAQRSLSVARKVVKEKEALDEATLERRKRLHAIKTA